MIFKPSGEEGEKPAEEGETTEKAEGEEGSKSPIPQVGWNDILMFSINDLRLWFIRI